MKVKKAIKNSAGKSQLLLIIIVLIIIVGLAIYFFTQRKSSSSQSSSQSGGQETVTEGKPLPEKDAIGTKDLEIIERYPGSVRTMYENPPDMKYESVTYVTKASIEDVKEYYLNELKDQGWNLVSSSEDELRFEKDPSTFRIHFYYDEADKILKYSLEYTLEPV